MSVIDFHSHILPGIDDGSKSPEMTRQMLRASAKQGVDLVVATPHFYARQDDPDHFLSKRAAAYDRLKEVWRPGMPEVICGAEVAFFSGMSHADRLKELCIQGTELMLLEMPFREWNDRILREVESVCRLGITPIIAHIERFYDYQKDKKLIPALLELPVYVQVNAECLLSWPGRRKAIPLFKKGYAQLLGSDAHNMDQRAPNLRAGRAVLEKKLGWGFLREMDALGEELLGLER